MRRWCRITADVGGERGKIVGEELNGWCKSFKSLKGDTEIRGGGGRKIMQFRS